MATVDITRIASNIGAMNSLNSLMNINAKLATHQTRLSTGKRINSAADDPAGLTIATKMLARSEGLKVTLDNIGDAKNMLSVAEGGLSKMTDIITQMRNKAEQAASDTLGASERATIQTQLSSYAEQLQDVVDQTKWNGVKLLDNTTGNKVFQTGVDEGESTTWVLPDKLDPTTLDLSNVVTASDTSKITNGGSYVSVSSKTVEASSTMNNMSELYTGDYSFEVMDQATSSTQGKASLSTNSKLISGTNGLSTVNNPGAAELASGKYSIKITNVTDATHVSYTITNLTDSAWNLNGSMTVVEEDISSGSLVDTAGTGTLGVDLGLVGTAADLVAGQSMEFEYIKSNQVKVELNDSSGQAVQIDRDGASTTTAAGDYGYATANTTFSTGRGISMKLDVLANVSKATGGLSFTYEQASNFSVDVSNATKAGAYMTTANNALDKVTSALSDLGSLMSRLTFKEESVSTAQLNVEAAHNRIMNANMAEEQMNASKYTILQQTAIAMLAQANQAPQNLLSLFR